MRTLPLFLFLCLSLSVSLSLSYELNNFVQFYQNGGVLQERIRLWFGWFLL